MSIERQVEQGMLCVHFVQLGGFPYARRCPELEAYFAPTAPVDQPEQDVADPCEVEEGHGDGAEQDQDQESDQAQT